MQKDALMSGRKGFLIKETKASHNSLGGAEGELPLHRVQRYSSSPRKADALNDLGMAPPEQLARKFKRGKAKQVLPLLYSMLILGLVRKSDTGIYQPTR